MDLIDFYETNDDFRVYLDKYCDKHKLTVEEAVSQKLVRYVAGMYMNLERENANKIFVEVHE